MKKFDYEIRRNGSWVYASRGTVDQHILRPGDIRRAQATLCVGAVRILVTKGMVTCAAAIRRVR